MWHGLGVRLANQVGRGLRPRRPPSDQRDPPVSVPIRVGILTRCSSDEVIKLKTVPDGTLGTWVTRAWDVFETLSSPTRFKSVHGDTLQSVPNNR